MTSTGKMLKMFNEAFAKSDSDYIIEQVTDQIVWQIVGDKTIKGKEEFIKEVMAMKNENKGEVEIHHIITHGKSASVNGLLSFPANDGSLNSYAFCDVYKLTGFKNPKISQITSYVIELT